jgi:ABC-type polysaccharide/polyol phosphate transport system ATPase subunit
MSLPTVSEALITMETNHSLPDELIRLENVTVRYKVPRDHFTTFKEYAIRLIQGRVKHDYFLALNDVSLSVRKGEVFGLIGPNGAGKSTLLKLVARVMRPTSGRVVVHGWVAPLLEMGAGFHPDLTGRENVYLNSAILGFPQHEVNSFLESVIDFSELQEFIDAPLRTYSSGMMARLGFAVATAVRPDVLIVDEILGVGDELFQQKCTQRIKGFCSEGTTIFMVSHNAGLIEYMCNRVAWLNHGKIMGIGSPKEMIQNYRTQQHFQPTTA